MELETRNAQPTEDDPWHEGQGNLQEFSLPQADGGRDAWLFLAASFMIEALVWGFPFAFGVFQDYYGSHEPFSGDKNVVIIGTCAMGIMYLDAPVVIGFLQSFPRFRRPAAGLGLIIMCLALSLSSFSSTTAHLIVTQGIFYAIGGSLAYSPTILFMDEWFVRRRGFAFGVMWAATGMSGVVLPLLLQWLLNSYGFRTTLRVWAVVLFVLTAPLLYFLKPRLPLSQTTRTRRFDFAFLKTSTFAVYQAGNVIQGLGFFLPSIYLPTYAKSLGASNLTSALTLILVNIASVFGCIIMGTIVDRYHVSTCMMISALGSAFGVFVIWGLAASLPALLVFCAIYGLFAGSFSTTYSGISRDVHRKVNSADMSIVFACLAAGRGIGNVASGPLSETLLKGDPWVGQAEFSYGTGYGPLIVFTGITAAVTGLCMVGRRAGWI